MIKEEKTMKKKILKISLLISLALIMALSLIACGSGKAEADDASGDWGNVHWEYKKDSNIFRKCGIMCTI